ncbi:MAG: hypothetical protein K6A30_03955 [Lachnospiraceae bacterium]|nr:hypothetical protein [Lachnospiraceae bacterium]
MPIAIFPFFIFIVCLINFLGNNTKKKDKESQSTFWDRETKANATPKKDISTLNYITLSEDLFHLHIDDAELTQLEEQVLSMKDKTILNLTGYSNTDLKLEYGAANLTALMEYDTNFTALCTAVFEWGKKLIDTGHIEEAMTVLEFGVNCGSDVTGNYTLLAHLYMDRNLSYRIDDLLKKAESLNSLSKDNIILKLNQIVHP